MWFIFVIIFILILVNGFFAGSEMALVSITKKDLKRMEEEKHKQYNNLKYILEDSTKYLSTIQVAITLAGFLSSAIAGSNLAAGFQTLLASISINISRNLAMVIITIILSYVTLVLGELVPKRIALNNAKRFAIMCAPVIRVLMIIVKPFVALLSLSTKLVLKLFRVKPKVSDDSVTERDLLEMIVSGQVQGLYQKEEQKMMERVLRFDDITVGRIMTPIDQVIGIDINWDKEKMKQQVKEYKFSRIPVYDKDINKILGVLVWKDLLLEEQQLTFENIKKLLREPHTTHKDEVINHLLHEMRKNNQQIAFVYDNDIMIGIVTVEDIIEELVGNIYDEHDDAYFQTDAFTYYVNANTTLKELKSQFDILFIDEDLNQTVSEHITKHHQSNKKLKQGQIITIKEVEFTIDQLDKQEIKRVRIRLLND